MLVSTRIENSDKLLHANSYKSNIKQQTSDTMDEVNEKLDKILNTLKKMTNTMDNIELQLKNNSYKLKEADTRLTAKCCSLKQRLNEINLPKIEALNTKLSLLEETVNNNNIKFINVSSHRGFSKLGNFQHETAKDLLAKEVYDKRFNILVHRTAENKNNDWETLGFRT